MRLIFAPAAEDDIRQIGRHIAQDNPARASTWIDDIEARCVQLATAPHRFPLVSRHHKSGLHMRPFGRYAIYYRITGEIVEIVRVLHMARDRDAILGDD